MLTFWFSTRNIRVSKALVIAGCALRFLPSFWTTVMPVLLMVLVIRTLIGTGPVETFFPDVDPEVLSSRTC